MGTDACVTAPLVRALCAALADEQIRYCHWKSNAFLDRTRTGDNDLDLLVDRADADRFVAILHRHGFKRVQRSGPELPGVRSYYGFDDGVDKLIHVHAHFQLVLGDDRTKSYRLPLEDAFLDEAALDGELLVPPVELELLVLVIRLVLKHLTWDAVVAHLTEMGDGARHEVAFLEARVDEERLGAALARHLPFVDPATFAECRRAVSDRRVTPRAVAAARRMVTELAPCARRSRAADVSLKLWRRGAGLAMRPSKRKRFDAGGVVIAVIGADGAGKSTAIDGVQRWLGRSFVVRRMHLGRPSPSAATRVLRVLTRGRNAIWTILGRRSRGDAEVNPWLAVSLARDRYRAVRAARMAATNGEVVLCDRFPLAELDITMDNPRIRRLLDPPGGLVAALARVEERYYRAMVRPDLLIVLLLDPEVAVRRKPDEDDEFIRRRWAEVGAVDWVALGAHVVDASRPASAVLADVKALIWSAL